MKLLYPGIPRKGMPPGAPPEGKDFRAISGEISGVDIFFAYCIHKMPFTFLAGVTH